MVWGAPPCAMLCIFSFELFQIDFEIYRWFVTASDYPSECSVRFDCAMCTTIRYFTPLYVVYDTTVDWWSLITDCITHWLSCVMSRNHGQQLNAFQRWWDGRKQQQQQLNHRYTNESDEGFWDGLGQMADAITSTVRESSNGIWIISSWNLFEWELTEHFLSLWPGASSSRPGASSGLRWLW